MRKILVPLLILSPPLASLSMRLPFAASQNCWYQSPRGAEQSAFRSAPPTSAMAPVDTEEFRQEFNGSADKVRIVALLSPTCPDCRSGHQIIRQVLKRFPSPELRAILVWEPIRGGDTPDSATLQARKVNDARIVQGWNENRSIGTLFGETLDLREIAWDVYLLYKPGVKWDSQRPPHPTFWMHQLQNADPDLLLCENPARLSSEVGKLLQDSR